MARETPSCRWTCVSVCLQSEESPSLSSKRLHNPSWLLFPPPQSKRRRFRKFAHPAGVLYCFKPGPGLARAHPPPSRAGKRLFIHVLS